MDERKCGKCKHFVPLPDSKEVGHCAIDGMPLYYTITEDCSYKYPYGFEPKDGEQE